MKNLLTIGGGVMIFAAGCITGSLVQKRKHEKGTTYAGDLQIVEQIIYNDGQPIELPPQFYMDLNVDPVTLIGSTDVIFKVRYSKI